ncbi:MAG: hypothetical protein R2724_34020 [Bryobacterales bacterium]
MAAVGLNISCPNVSGGIDFGTDPKLAGNVVPGCSRGLQTPGYCEADSECDEHRRDHRAAADAGADAVSMINTFQAMAINWRKQAIAGSVVGELSGPAIRAIALRMVWQVAKAINIPVIGIRGIASLDDVAGFLVAGASASSDWHRGHHNPTLVNSLPEELAKTLAAERCSQMSDIIGSLQIPERK